MVTSGSWLFALVITVLSAGFFLFMLLFDKLFDLILPIGVRSASKPRTESRTPLLRALSLPAGFVIGVLLARSGLDTGILELLSEHCR